MSSPKALRVRCKKCKGVYKAVRSKKNGLLYPRAHKERYMQPHGDWCSGRYLPALELLKENS